VKLAGRVKHICGTRTLVIECDPGQLPRLHVTVTDRRLKPVGKLVEVFGNIKAPYGLVVCKGTCTSIPGEKLFTK